MLSGLPPGGTDVGGSPTNGTAAAAVFNLTATAGNAPTTFLSVAVPTGSDACPTTAPSFSNLNPTPVRPAEPGDLDPGSQSGHLHLQRVGSINFIIDVNGWFGNGHEALGAFFYSVPPTRICDTRAHRAHQCGRSHWARCVSRPDTGRRHRGGPRDSPDPRSRSRWWPTSPESREQRQHSSSSIRATLRSLPDRPTSTRLPMTSSPTSRSWRFRDLTGSTSFGDVSLYNASARSTPSSTSPAGSSRRRLRAWRLAG